VSKNHFAGYVELAALLAVGLATGLADEARRDKGWLSWIESRRAKWVVLAWGVAFVLVLAVLVSLSRGGVVAVSAGLTAFALLRLWARGTSRLTPGGALALLALLVAAGASFIWILPADARARVASLGAVTSESSGSYRLAVWRDTRGLIASSPLVGSGFGAYEDALRRFRTAAGEVAVEHAESDVLEAVAEGGALAALGLLWLAGGLALLGLRAVRSEPQRLPRGVAAGALAGLLALGVHSLFDFNLHLPSNALLASALATVLVAGATQGQPSPTSRRLLLAAAAGGLTLALATTWRPAFFDAGVLQRAAPAGATSLRRAALEREAVATLRQRPTDASTWLCLSWLRQKSGLPLAAWALRLDPSNAGMAQAAERLRTVIQPLPPRE
jgi:O-antigen ligase